jgi:hypothetical protein
MLDVEQLERDFPGVELLILASNPQCGLWVLELLALYEEEWTLLVRRRFQAETQLKSCEEVRAAHYRRPVPEERDFLE